MVFPQYSWSYYVTHTIMLFSFFNRYNAGKEYVAWLSDHCILFQTVSMAHAHAQNMVEWIFSAYANMWHEALKSTFQFVLLLIRIWTTSLRIYLERVCSVDSCIHQFPMKWMLIVRLAIVIPDLLTDFKRWGNLCTSQIHMQMFATVAEWDHLMVISWFHNHPPCILTLSLSLP